MNTNMVGFSLLLLLAYVTTAESKVYQCDSSATCGCSQNPVSINVLIVNGEIVVNNTLSSATPLKIVNGETAGVDTLSWATSLKIVDGMKTGLCGGAIIADSYVLTAAHCVDGKTPSMITAYFGSIDLFEGSSRPVSKIYSHPQYYPYSSGGSLNDIALLKLSTPLNMADKTLAKICLPKDSTTLPENSNVIAMGWGTTQEQGSVSGTLQQVTLNIIGSETDWCKDVATDVKTQYCAGIMPSGGKGELL